MTLQNNISLSLNDSTNFTNGSESNAKTSSESDSLEMLLLLNSLGSALEVEDTDDETLLGASLPPPKEEPSSDANAGYSSDYLANLAAQLCTQLGKVQYDMMETLKSSTDQNMNISKAFVNAAVKDQEDSEAETAHLKKLMRRAKKLGRIISLGGLLNTGGLLTMALKSSPSPKVRQSGKDMEAGTEKYGPMENIGKGISKLSVIFSQAFAKIPGVSDKTAKVLGDVLAVLAIVAAAAVAGPAIAGAASAGGAMFASVFGETAATAAGTAAATTATTTAETSATTMSYSNIATASACAGASTAIMSSGLAVDSAMLIGEAAHIGDDKTMDWVIALTVILTLVSVGIGCYGGSMMGDMAGESSIAKALSGDMLQKGLMAMTLVSATFQGACNLSLSDVQREQADVEENLGNINADMILYQKLSDSVDTTSQEFSDYLSQEINGLIRNQNSVANAIPTVMGALANALR